MTAAERTAAAARRAIAAAGGIANQAELARHWGVNAARARQLVTTPGFPEPVAAIGTMPVWAIAEADEWRTNRPPAGRPRKGQRMIDTDTALRMLVAAARRAAVAESVGPEPGDLVVEITRFDTDPDAIGWLIGHDDAPYNADDPLDGSVPMREVWDIRPLNPAAKLQTIGEEQVQRWENATFLRVPPHIARHAPALQTA